VPVKLNSYTSPDTSQPGTYTIQVIANDTSNNINNTEFVTITVNDVTVPVFNSLTCAPDPANISQVVTCTVNITDDVSVDTVLANVTQPNGSVFVQSVGLVSGDVYEFNFTGTNSIDLYNVTWLVNDTSGNSDTAVDNFTVQDVVNPIVVVGDCVPDPANVGQTVVCNATITDDVSVDTVLANVTLPNGSVLVQSIGNVGDVFSFNFTGTTLINLYNVSWLANDTTGNSDTDVDNFTVQDVVNPSVVIVSPVNGSVFNISQLVNITANVTDDVAVDTVLANVTFPNGTSVLFSTTPQAVPVKLNSYTSPDTKPTDCTNTPPLGLVTLARTVSTLTSSVIVTLHVTV